MKKLILTLGFVLGLGGLTATQAQMRVYNENLVKFGNINTNPTLSSGLEVAMSSFLFKGKQAKFTIMGTTLELLANNAAATPYTINSVSSDDANIAITMGPSLSIVGVKDKLGLGSSAQPFYSVFATKLYSASGGVSTLSDRRYKTNIRNIESASDKIMRLRPVAFDYTDEKDNAATVDSTRMNKIGLIAQELVKVVPEAVQYLVPDDIYTVDYTVLIPLLIKTVQEQQAQIEALKTEVRTLQTAR